jgi:hypothetical protein
MPSSKRHMNWKTVTFTIAGGATVTLTGVTSIRVEPGGNVIKHSGDADHGPSLIVNDFQDTSITISGRDLANIHLLPPGTRGAVAATHLDAKDQSGATGTGAYILGLANAVVVNNPGGGDHRQFGDGQIVINGEWPDGITNPLSYAAV